MPDADQPGRIRRGTQAFWHSTLALFAAGLTTFALLYCVQPLMPLLSVAFGQDAARTSLVLSVTTLPLAFAMLGASVVAGAIGPKTVMVASLLASAVLAASCGFARDFGALLVLRALMGLTLSGLPAVAMAYVSQEMEPAAAGFAMGLYIGGTALGGMTGRLLAAVLAESVSWRAALCGIGVEGLVGGLLLWRFLPPPRHAPRQSLALLPVICRSAGHLRQPGLRALILQGFLLMGSFVTIYNYLPYRLSAPPYSVGPGRIGAIFSVYLVGMVASPLMGDLALRKGRRPVLAGNLLVMLFGLALTMLHPIVAIIAGMVAFTAGFFGAHAVVSAWIGFRAGAAAAQASALYLLAYYMGGSLIGTFGGVVWHAASWPGVCALVAVLLVVGLVGAVCGGQARQGALPLDPIKGEPLRSSR